MKKYKFTVDIEIKGEKAGHVIKLCEARRASQKIWSRTNQIHIPVNFITFFFITIIYSTD